MRKPSIYKQLLAFFLAGIVGFTALGGWISVQAETKSPISPNTEQLNLVGDGKPFKPDDLEQSEKGGPIIDLIDGLPYIVALNNGEITNTVTHKDIINFAVKMDFLDKLTARN